MHAQQYYVWSMQPCGMQRPRGLPGGPGKATHTPACTFPAAPCACTCAALQQHIPAHACNYAFSCSFLHEPPMQASHAGSASSSGRADTHAQDSGVVPSQQPSQSMPMIISQASAAHRVARRLAYALCVLGHQALAAGRHGGSVSSPTNPRPEASRIPLCICCFAGGGARLACCSIGTFWDAHGVGLVV